MRASGSTITSTSPGAGSVTVTCCGAAGEVTGSGYLVTTPRATVLVDFGMFQGRRDAGERNRSLGPVDPSRLDAVVVTHAHLDHVGRLPLLVDGPKDSKAYRGPIFATPATHDLAEIMLEDAAKIQEQDAERANRRRERDGGEPDLPPFTAIFGREHIARLRPLRREVPLEQPTAIAPGVRVRLFEAGHILGSASVEMTIDAEAAGNGRARVIIFSGDIGPRGMPLLRDPCPPTIPERGQVDLVFLESTYGNRDHRPRDATVREFHEVLRIAAWEKRRLLVPAFAVGRTQQILFHLAQAVRDNVIPDFPVYLDSPLADKATRLHAAHRSLYDAESADLARRRQFERDLRHLRVIETAAQSRELNETWDECMIIAGSGMCDGGRIVHHLRHGLWRRNVSVLLTGYQAQGTLGRRLAEGAKEVNIFRERVPVRASIHTIGGLSAHAGQTELVEWLSGVAGAAGAAGDALPPPRIALTHGEDPQRHALAAKINERYGLRALLPALGETIVV